MWQAMRPKVWHSLTKMCWWLCKQICLYWKVGSKVVFFFLSLLITFLNSFSVWSVNLHQLRLRDYFLENQNKAPIGPDDILNIFPLIKYIHMPTVDASAVHKTARTSVQKGGSNELFSCCYLCTFQQNRKTKNIIFYLMCCGFSTGLLDQGHEQLKEAAYLFSRVSDDLHPESCHCYSLLAKVAYLQAKTAEVGLRLSTCLQKQ